MPQQRWLTCDDQIFNTYEEAEDHERQLVLRGQLMDIVEMGRHKGWEPADLVDELMGKFDIGSKS